MLEDLALQAGVLPVLMWEGVEKEKSCAVRAGWAGAGQGCAVQGQQWVCWWMEGGQQGGEGNALAALLKTQVTITSC